MLLYGPVLNTPDFVVSASVDETGVLLGAFLEVLLVIAVIGTAVTLYPIIRKQNEGIALKGFRASPVPTSVTPNVMRKMAPAAP